MSMKAFFVKVRENYVMNQVARLKIPKLPNDEYVRYRVRFSGRVQHVGFRLEVSELAKRLEVTGYCKNLENGDVLAEFQGMKNRIVFILRFMDSLKRIKIKEKKMKKLELNFEEEQFETF